MKKKMIKDVPFGTWFSLSKSGSKDYCVMGFSSDFEVFSLGFRTIDGKFYHHCMYVLASRFVYF